MRLHKRVSVKEQNGLGPNNAIRTKRKAKAACDRIPMTMEDVIAHKQLHYSVRNAIRTYRGSIQWKIQSEPQKIQALPRPETEYTHGYNGIQAIPSFIASNIAIRSIQFRLRNS